MIPRTNAAIPPACRVLWSGYSRNARTQRANGLPRLIILAPVSSSPIHRRSDARGPTQDSCHEPADCFSERHRAFSRCCHARECAAGPVAPAASRATGPGRARRSIPIPTSSRSIRGSTATSSATRRFDGCYTGTLWAEGPAWNGVGTLPGLERHPEQRADAAARGRRSCHNVPLPSGYSNGNTFDFKGRQLSSEHGGRRVVRYEPNGTVTVIAERYQGKRLNSPNDVVVHPDGAMWFTDPMYGIAGNYEGFKADSELPMAVYRVDRRTAPSRRSVTNRPDRTGSASHPITSCCTSPIRARARDQGLRDRRPVAAQGADVREARFAGIRHRAAADGIRCDTDGNIWAGRVQASRSIAPNGKPIGVIRLPENCANVCFGGTKRNRLFMTASQSLYAVYVNIAGAHIA